MNERSIFLAALEITNASERADYVAHACGDDIKLLRDVHLMLAEHERSGKFLELIGIDQPGAHDAPSEVTHVVLMADGDTYYAESDGTQLVAEDDDLSIDDREVVLESRETPHAPDDHVDTWIRTDHPSGARGSSVESSPPAHDGRPDAPLRVDLGFLSPPEKPGSLGQMGHFDIQEVLGRGSHGVVLKALDERTHVVVALKVLSPEFARYSPSRKRFLREARAAAAVHHSNVVAVHAVEEQPTPYLVMEYIAGGTLQQRLEQAAPLDAAEVLDLARQIARGLAAAHDAGLIHGDLKPADILIEAESGRVVVADFGLARVADDANLSQSGFVSGLPLYASPEQAQGAAIDPRSDLFSLGSVLYALCTGRAPFRAPSIPAVLKRVRDDVARPIQQVVPETPTLLVEIIAKLHAKNPRQRFASAQDLGEAIGLAQTLVAGETADEANSSALQRLLHLEAPPARVVPAPTDEKPRSAGVRLLLAVLLIGAAAAALKGCEPTRPTSQGAATKDVHARLVGARGD